MNPAVCANGQLDSLLLLLGEGGGLILCFLLEGRLGKFATVEREVGGVNISYLLDLTGLAQVLEEGSGDRSIYLELFHND